MTNCIVLRCGSTEVADSWVTMLAGSDVYLIVSFYNSDSYEAFTVMNEQSVSKHLWIGGKWTGIYDALCSKELSHEYYFFPDDDITLGLQEVEALFEQMKALGAEVGQPSLSHDSYFSHLITLHHPGLIWRKTNFVEVMVPCLSSLLLRKVLPIFETTESGFGLDYVWCMYKDSFDKAYIFDSIQVCHTRPIGTHLAKAMKEQGRPMDSDEWRVLNQYFGISGKQIPLVELMLTDRGTVVGNRLLRVVCIWWSLRGECANRGLLDYKVDLRRYLKRQLLRVRSRYLQEVDSF